MIRARFALLAAIVVATVHCGSASAPETAPPDDNAPQSDSPAGRIAFVTEVSPFNGALYVANSDGSGLRKVANGPAYYSRPRWSPDHRRIAFSQMGEDLVSAVYVIDVDGRTGPVRLAAGMHPAWSPDGKKIVFTSSDGVRLGDFGLFVMNADGTELKRLTSPNDPAQCSVGASANDLRPDWSPDGTKILFERQINTDDSGGVDCGLDGYGYIPYVYVVNVDGTGLRKFRSAGSTVSANPSWSPDGRAVAFNLQLGGMVVTDSDGSSERPIDSRVDGSVFSPVWSPDGKKLLFVNVTPPAYRLVVHDLASGTTEVIGFPTVPGIVLDPAWSR